MKKTETILSRKSDGEVADVEIQNLGEQSLYVQHLVHILRLASFVTRHLHSFKDLTEIDQDNEHCFDDVLLRTAIAAGRDAEKQLAECVSYAARFDQLGNDLYRKQLRLAVKCEGYEPLMGLSDALTSMAAAKETFGG